MATNRMEKRLLAHSGHSGPRPGQVPDQNPDASGSFL